MALCYDGTDVRLHRYVSFDFAGDVDSWRSTTDYVFTLGSRAVSLVSKLQKIVTLSMRRPNMLQHRSLQGVDMAERFYERA